jgi:hypothetical protein
MDQFEYAVTIQKISKAKTLKAKEAIIRELHKRMPDRWDAVNTNNFGSTTLIYKATMYAIKGFTNYDKLPDFIKQRNTHIGTNLLKYITDNMLPYTILADVFEHSDTVRMYSDSGEQLKALAMIVKELQFNCKLVYTFSAPARLGYLFTSVGKNITTSTPEVSRSITMELLVFVESIKRELPNTCTNYTIIENCLSTLYTALTRNSNFNNEEMLLRVTTMENNLTDIKTIAAKVAQIRCV